jgi:hypothetical protein
MSRDWHGGGRGGRAVSSPVQAYYLHTVTLLRLLAGVIACCNRYLDAVH